MKKTKIFAVLGILICMLFAIFTGSCAYVLEAPTGFDIDDDLVLSWTAVENARNYEIEIKVALYSATYDTRYALIHFLVVFIVLQKVCALTVLWICPSHI